MAFTRITSSSSIEHSTMLPSPPDFIWSGSVRINPTPDLHSTDSRINQSAVHGQLEAFDSLHIVSENIFNMVNLEPDRDVLQKRKDACKSPDFNNILDDYFENSIPLTLEVCSALVEYCSKCQCHLNEFSLGSFQEQHSDVSSREGDFKNFSRNFLENVWTSTNPFPVDHFSRVYSKQIAMMSRLQTERMKLEGSFDRLVFWRKVSNRTFIIMFGSALIGSVVSVYKKAPAGLTALIAAITVPLGSIGRWINWTWEKSERNLKEQRDIIRVMQIGSDIVFQEFTGIAELVDRFQIESEDLLAYANLTTWENQEGFVIAMMDVKRKVDELVKTIHGLSEHSNKCAHKTKMANAAILRRINMNHPGGSNLDIAMFP